MTPFEFTGFRPQGRGNVGQQIEYILQNGTEENSAIVQIILCHIREGFKSEYSHSKLSYSRWSMSRLLSVHGRWVIERKINER
jgi:hypothetical protein